MTLWVVELFVFLLRVLRFFLRCGLHIGPPPVLTATGAFSDLISVEDPLAVHVL